MDEQRWISVKERLPEPHMQVLAAYLVPGGKEICCCRLSVGQGYPCWYQQAFSGLKRWLDIEITHWMSMPSLPQESEE